MRCRMRVSAWLAAVMLPPIALPAAPQAFPAEHSTVDELNVARQRAALAADRATLDHAFQEVRLQSD
jgi:hypothetical protein